MNLEQTTEKHYRETTVYDKNQQIVELEELQRWFLMFLIAVQINYWQKKFCMTGFVRYH